METSDYGLHIKSKSGRLFRGNTDSEFCGDKNRISVLIHFLVLWSVCLMEIQDGQRKCDFVFY